MAAIPKMLGMSKKLEIPDKLTAPFLSKHKDNQAVQFAYISSKSKRSTNSVTLLLLGLSGAGKSSVANRIFDAEVCKVGDLESVTDCIEELTVKMPSEDLEVSNTKVIVVDTPGFGDSEKGTEFDAKTLISIKKFFAGKQHYPNFVLIAVNITDKRLSGSTSQFVKMLQAMKSSLTGSVIDPNKCNVILVFTHLMSLKPSQRKPEQLEQRRNDIKKLVSLHLGISQLYDCVAENEVDDYNLPKVGDFYKLPNGDLYPENLLYQLIRCSRANEDKIGQALINEAIRRGALFSKPIKTTIAIEPNKEAAALVQDVQKLSLGKSDSEIRRFLREKGHSFEPDVIETLGLELESCGITKREQIPSSKKELMRLMKQLRPNENAVNCLHKALGIRVPHLDIDLYLGRGYDLTKDNLSNASSATLTENLVSSIGCYLPSNVEAFEEPSAMCFHTMIQSMEEYVKCRLHDLRVSGIVSSFSGSAGIKHGYNISSSDSSENLTAIYEKTIYKLRLKSACVTDDFKTSVRALPLFPF